MYLFATLDLVASLRLDLRRRPGPVRRHREERGFALPELLVVVAIPGILLPVATATWLGVLDQRRVDPAATQVAADMRLAHARATNRLVAWEVRLTANDGTYRLVEVPPAPASPTITTRSLPERTAAKQTATFALSPPTARASAGRRRTPAASTSSPSAPPRAGGRPPSWSSRPLPRYAWSRELPAP